MAKIEKRSMLISGNYCGHHIFVLDEIDNLTQRAQASLKGAMGIPDTIFIMTTNFVYKVDAGVQTRCVRVNCNAAAAHDYLPFARQTLMDCGANLVSDDKLLPVIQHCKGCVRDIAEAMQRIAAVQKARANMAAAA
jgi:DNA polymerase III delta prime subunit